MYNINMIIFNNLKNRKIKSIKTKKNVKMYSTNIYVLIS